MLRFTQGELFLPMPVESYLQGCSLWRLAGPDRGWRRRAAAERLCAAGDLTPARLAQFAEQSGDLSLRFVERALDRREFRAWRRDAGRPRLAAGRSRLAAVGLLGRLIDAVLRLSLLLRGQVPGGTAAAAEQHYRAQADPGSCPYYGRVTRDRGFIALQYWFFYAMNDWRSTFGGVNDHEADWEQVTVFLADPRTRRPGPPGSPSRRMTKPATIFAAGTTTPTCSGGAPTRSCSPAPARTRGPTLPGDYVVTVEPPALGRLLAALRRLGRLFLPWRRGDAGTAFGIPFIDYHRGDGPGAGPGEARNWCPVLIDDQTPWLHGYRGLWGLDTGDPFGGERAPAGPRYERDGSVRLCWSDPVGWAGLDKEIPSAAAERQAVAGRIAELDAQLAAAADELAARGDELRGARAGIRALGSDGPAADPAALAGLEAAVAQLRLRRQALAREREALARAASRGLPREDPHAHLRHRARPDVDPGRTRSRVLRVWSAVSASLLLIGLAAAIVGQLGALLPALGGLAVVMLCAEAFARGHLVQFVAGLLAAAVAAGAAALAAWAIVGHWRSVTAVLLILAATALLLASARDFFRKR